MQSKIKKAGCICFCATLLLTGCAGVDMQDPLPDASGNNGWYAEAYLDIDPAINKPEQRKLYPGRGDIGIRQAENGQSIEKTEPLKNASNKITLKAESFADVTIYRIEDTEYFLSKLPNDNPNTRTAIANWASFYSKLSREYPNVDFYSYYIRRAEDYDWFESVDNGESTSSLIYYDYYSFLSNEIDKENNITQDSYEMADINDYIYTGQKTDFHLNYIGSDRVYSDVYNMLSANMQLSPKLTPVKTWEYKLRFVGDLFSQAAYEEREWNKDNLDFFTAYEYDIAPYTSYLNEVPTVLGMETEYMNGEIPDEPRFGHQFAYYGGQTGIIRYEFNNPEKKNLLILSDSQGRPSRVPIASHFNTTVYLDDVQTRNLNVSEFIEEYNIDVVLYMGQRSMFEFYE